MKELDKSVEKVIDDLAKWGDDQLDFTKIVGGMAGAALETIDRPFFRIILKVGVSKLNAENQAVFMSVANAVMAGDVESLRQTSVDKIVDMLKTPLGDRKERIIVGHVTAIFFELAYDHYNEIASKSVGGGGPDDDPDGNGG